MAICGSCGAESARVRSRWVDDKQLPDECQACAPESFERFKSVRDGTIAMGYEYMPNMYRKTDAGYVAKDELLADTEAQATKPSEDDERAYKKAVEEKRRHRRTHPMSAREIELAISKFRNQSESRQSQQTN